MYLILKTVDDKRFGTRYFLILAKEKIDRIAKLRSFRSIAYADEVYPVAVQELSAPAYIGDSIFDRFLREVPQNVWMDSDELRKLIDEFVRKLHEGFTVWLRKITDNWVPTTPKGRIKEKYPKVLDYSGYAPYKWRVVARLKKTAVNVVKINRWWSIYFFKRSFAIDENRDCMVFLPYDVSMIDAEKVYANIYLIRPALRVIMENSNLDLPEEVRAVIDYVWLIAGTAGE
jgi:hypothetical protein